MHKVNFMILLTKAIDFNLSLIYNNELLHGELSELVEGARLEIV